MHAQHAVQSFIAHARSRKLTDLLIERVWLKARHERVGLALLLGILCIYGHEVDHFSLHERRALAAEKAVASLTSTAAARRAASCQGASRGDLCAELSSRISSPHACMRTFLSGCGYSQPRTLLADVLMAGCKLIRAARGDVFIYTYMVLSVQFA